MTAEEKSVLSLFMIGVLIVVGKVLAGGEPITPRLFIGRMLLGGFVSMVARCSTLSSSNVKTAPTILKTCSCVNLLTTRRRCSRSRSCNAAWSTRWKNGKTMLRFTPEMKTAMVLKAKDVIRRGCLEYDVSATDITSSFMAIRKTMTSSGRSATYEASRSEEASHADLAWATMHALLNEPLTAGISTPLTSTILEFY